ncbi:MAG: GWxTD domain-containing protein [candidate division Zixibacteria bacterium]|nr:GWxTD domain-containing protein [candidate division Zixibacteria bacterium]MCI0595323.1 GWxTD domain-containing protein [candidate division Zixibacteria bacterium]
MKLFAASLTVLFAAAALFGQNPLSKDSRVGIPPFEVDFAAFADTAKGKSRLEVYYKLRNVGFSFVKKGNEYQAAYDVEVSLEGENGREVASKNSSEEFTVPTYDQTQSLESYRLNAAHFSVKPGNYKIKIHLTDNNSKEISTAARKAEVPDFTRGALAASGLLLIGAFADSANLPLFKKEGRTAIPSVSRAFGDPDSLFHFYFEVYSKHPERKAVRLEYEITQRHHGAWIKETDSLELTGSKTPVFARLPVGKFPPGDYRLKVTLREGKKELAKREAEFKMSWNWEAALTYNFKDVVDLLRYFARETDVRPLEKAPPEKRLEAWDQFWRERDPTPATRENEAKQEFEQRVRFADAYFAYMGLPGWKSDMGKIYIRYGGPDQVDEDPSGLRNTNPFAAEDEDRYTSNVTRIRRTGHASQTWYYFSFRRAFSFEDVTGNGSWVLRPPFDGRRF